MTAPRRGVRRERYGAGRAEPADEATSDPGIASALQGWFAGRIPSTWFTTAPEVTYDRDEILVVGDLAEPELPDADDAARAAAREARIAGFREDTRPARMRIADEAEERFGRKVAWGATCGERREVFT